MKKSNKIVSIALAAVMMLSAAPVANMVINADTDTAITASASYSKSVSLSSKDKAYLKRLANDFYQVNYNSSSSYAKTKAYNTMFGEVDASVFDNFNYFGWSYSCVSKDPKNIARRIGADNVYKFSASKVDWILRNVYGVTPDHSKVVKFYGTTTAYYSNGYYYYLESYCGETFAEFAINSVALSNGCYTVKGGVYEEGSNHYSKWGNFSAKFKLKTVDGKKVWRVVQYNYTNA